MSRERCGLPGYPAATARGWLAWTLGERGTFDEGLACGWEGIRVAETLDHPYSLIMSCWCLASLCLIRGHVDPATRLLERARSAAADSKFWYPLFNGPLGYACALAGRIDQGCSLLREALSLGQTMKLGVYEAIRLVQLGEALLLADRPADALEPARRALSLARQRGERGHEAWALRLLGEIASHHAHPDVATVESHYGAAMALATELGMRPLVAHCHHELGKLHRRTGDRARAGEHLVTATTMFREMDMGLWLAKAEATLTGADE
jgi:tetratricopeptide (TPR) repeat protein